MTSPARPLTASRFFRIIFWFNAPLILLIVLFNFWRAYMHGEGGACADTVCTLIERYGDASPIVSSFTEEALRRGASVNISLARELLFFNVTFGVTTALLAILAFALALPKLGLIGPIRYPAAILVIPPAIAILAFMLYIIGWDTSWPTPTSHKGTMGRLIFTYWAGAFVYNGRCLRSPCSACSSSSISLMSSPICTVASLDAETIASRFGSGLFHLWAAALYCRLKTPPGAVMSAGTHSRA